MITHLIMHVMTRCDWANARYIVVDAGCYVGSIIIRQFDLLAISYVQAPSLRTHRLSRLSFREPTLNFSHIPVFSE